MKKVFVPYIGQNARELDPYWCGARETFYDALAHTRELVATIASVGIATAFDIKTHDIDDVPAQYRRALPSIFPTD